MPEILFIEFQTVNNPAELSTNMLVRNRTVMVRFRHCQRG